MARLVCGDNIEVTRYDRDVDIVPGAILIADTVISDCRNVVPSQVLTLDDGAWLG